MSKEVPVTFKTDEEQAERLGQTAFDIDASKSDVIRTALFLTLDFIKAHPAIIYRIQGLDRADKDK